MATKKCSSCNESISETAKFCPHCGASNIKAYCRACGKEMSINDIACTHCGTLVNEKQTPIVDPTKGEKYELALGGFIASFMVPLVGLILGIIAINANKGVKNSAKTFGTLAVIIGAANMVFTMLVFFFYFIAIFASVL